MAALEVLTHVDLGDPAEVREALRVVLARRPNDLPLVDRALDAFFWGDLIRFQRRPPTGAPRSGAAEVQADKLMTDSPEGLMPAEGWVEGLTEGPPEGLVAEPTVGPPGGPTSEPQDGVPEGPMDGAGPAGAVSAPTSAPVNATGVGATPGAGATPGTGTGAGSAATDGGPGFPDDDAIAAIIAVLTAAIQPPRPAAASSGPSDGGPTPGDPPGGPGGSEGDAHRGGTDDVAGPGAPFGNASSIAGDEPGPLVARAGGSPGGYSPLAVLTRRDVQFLDARDRTLVLEAARRLGRWLATRPSRRFVRARKGVIDGRRALREAARKAGDLTRWPRRRRKPDRSRLVCLLDVSGSMDVYSRLFLHFLYGLQQAGGRVETFAIGTRLTRLTPVLRTPRVDLAMARAAAVTVDWSGGTRLGECLWAFLQRYRGLLDRDTVLLVVSDGLDRGNLDLLERCLQACRRRVRALVWMNPLAGDPRYEPRAQGMQVALPFIDILAPAHSVESLVRLVDFLARRPRLVGRRGPGTRRPVGR